MSEISAHSGSLQTTDGRPVAEGDALDLLSQLLGSKLEGETLDLLVRAVRTLVHEVSSRELESLKCELGLLRSVRQVLCSVFEPEAAFSIVARMAVPTLADVCVVDLVRAETAPAVSLRRHEVVVDPRISDSCNVATAIKNNPPRPDAPHGPHLATRAGVSTLLPEVSDETLAAEARDGRHLEILRDLSPFSYVCVPIQGGGAIVGAMTFLSLQPGRRYGPNEKEIAEDLAAHCGLVELHATRAKAAVRETVTFQVHTEASDLTPRQLEVLRLVAQGLSNRDIAARLHLSQNTVDTHAKHIRGALGASSRLEAVKKARDIGLLAP
jgi:DNA-binding CsgD family transcriptional regulator